MGRPFREELKDLRDWLQEIWWLIAGWYCIGGATAGWIALILYLVTK